MKTRILIVDDHPVVRRGLATTLGEAPDVVVAGEAADGDEAIAKARDIRPDLVLLDIALPGKSGLEVLKTLRAEMPDLAVLVISTFPERQYAVRCLRNGARGYLTKSSAPEELLEAVRKIRDGGKYISPPLADLLAAELTGDVERLPHERLSDREFQVLCMLGRGQSVSDVASALSLSVSTVHTHRAHVLEKMNLETTAQLVRYVLDHNLSESPE
ncbi:MAG TPA: response regulator transcription factor [Bacteroidota bacterium]|nr:response regulator transcription factor [Bacteroidota bacterium]